MKQRGLRPWTMALCMLAMWPLNAQVTTPANSGFSGDFVGWNNTMTTAPLMIKHEANQPIWIFTDAIWRATMNETVTYGLLGGFSSVPANGFTLLGEDAAEFKNGGAPGPYTMLHLAAATDNAQQLSYRPWQRNGITFTGNANHGYVGQKGKEPDYTDMIVHWSDKERLKRPRPNAPC